MLLCPSTITYTFLVVFPTLTLSLTLTPLSPTDAHISKVFDSSHQTPSRSGARSPAVAGAAAARRAPQRPPPHRRDRDVLSTFSADSGTGQDLAASQLSLERQRRAQRDMTKSRTFPDYGGSASGELVAPLRADGL